METTDVAETAPPALAVGPTRAPPDAVKPARAGHGHAWWMAGWMAALSARALWITLVHEPSRAVFSDMGGYFHRSGDVLWSARWDPFVFFQGAGYPLVLAAVRKLWASDGDVGLVTAWVQVGASLLALAGTVYLARSVAGRGWAGAALAVGAFHVPWIFFNSVYMAEALYTAVLAGLGVVLVVIARAPDARWRFTLLLGVLGGLAGWLKSAHLLLGPVAAVLWLVPLRRGWRGSARILAGWIAGLALALWIPHGWLSLQRSGRFMASAPAGGLNFVEGKCPSKENKDSTGSGYWSPLYVQLGRRNTKTWPRPFMDQGYFYGEGLKCIAERPVVLLESFEAIPFLFVGNELWPANACGTRAVRLSAAWARLFEWPLAAGVLVAFAVALARWRRPLVAGGQRAAVWLALAAPALSLFAVVWITKSELRTRIPFDVFLVPLALWGWRELAAASGRLGLRERLSRALVSLRARRGRPGAAPLPDVPGGAAAPRGGPG